jgi:hypothetical protein
LITISSSHPAAGLGWGFVQSWLLHQFKKNAIPAPEEKQFLLFYNKKNAPFCLSAATGRNFN